MKNTFILSILLACAFLHSSCAPFNTMGALIKGDLSSDTIESIVGIEATVVTKISGNYTRSGVVRINGTNKTVSVVCGSSLPMFPGEQVEFTGSAHRYGGGTLVVRPVKHPMF